MTGENADLRDCYETKIQAAASARLSPDPDAAGDPAEGLSPQETKLRQSNGLSNIMPPSNTKSEGQIIKENVLTFFNLIFLVLALCLCLVGSFKNLMFLLVAVANTVVGSFQEIRAKRAVDKLTLVAAGTAKAIPLRPARLRADGSACPR